MLIQKLRLQHGWSQEQLAELSGLSVRTIQRIERGQNASVETLKSLGAVFGIDFSVLKEPDMPHEPTPQNVPGPLTNAEALALAQVRKLKGFYEHVALYVMVNAMLVVADLATRPRHFWAVWPILGWGVGLTLHGLKVFDKIPVLTADWERRQVEKRLGRKL